MILDVVLIQNAGLALVVLAVGLVLYDRLRTKRSFEVRPKLPKLPIVGAREGEWFPKLGAWWRNSIDVRTATQEAYKFKDQLCILPIVDLGSTVILPPTDVGWYYDLPDSDVSTHDHLFDAFQLHWTLTDPQLMEDERPIHHILISTKLTRQMNNILPTLAVDIPCTLRDAWGTDTENFKQICPMTELPPVVGPVANLAFVGAATCYNKTLVNGAIDFAQGLAITAIVVRLTPQVLRPLVTPLVTLPQRIGAWRFFGALRPELNRRLQELSTDPGSASKYNDFLQWTIDAAIESGDPYMMKPETIMGRLLLLNFLAIHTTALTVSHATSPANIEELRTEIASALEANGGKWTKKTLAEMPKLDSMFRESHRMNPPTIIGSPKLVVAREGITTPEGVHLRYGTYLSIMGYPIFRDPTLYPEPETFKPFRFSELLEDIGSQGLVLEKARQGWTRTGKWFSTFGGGRHACPGRFFASASSKIFLAHVLMNYDIEKVPERAPGPTVGMLLLPPFTATIRVRRRKEAI
ncbi:hypothetical protein B7463_g11706, partial [Scytalidium lignicola]